MATTIADMTYDDLRSLVAQMVREQMKVWPRPYDPRSTREILDSIDRNIWTPPPGSPSTAEALGIALKPVTEFEPESE